MLRQKTQRAGKMLAVLMLLFIASPNVFADDYTAAIQKGLDYLRGTQDQNTGAWLGSYPVGSTGLATLAFLNHGIGESDQQVKKAIEYIVSQQGTDGRIGNHPGYTTAIAISALRATGNHDYDEVIRKAKDYYVNNQNADGGWRYDPSYTTSDHSVYQWGVLGIYEAYEFLGLERNDATWGNAKRYLTTTQHQDGGWGYQNGSSYGSMTAAGLWSSFYCGIPLTDQGSQKALEWVGQNYTWTTNPGSGSWLRYYQYTLAKALALYGKKAIVDSSGVTHDWHKELSEMLVAQQQPDGRWTGALYDSGDVLATSYVLLILELRTWPRGRYSITFELESEHSDIYVFDPTGLQVSRDIKEIDEAEFSAGPPQKIALNKSEEESKGIIAGRYYVEIKASEDDTYTLTITGTKNDADTGEETTFFGPEAWSETIPQGRIHCLAANVNLIAGVGIVIASAPHLNPIMELLPNLIEVDAEPGEVIERKLIINEISMDKDMNNVVLSASDLVVEGQKGELIPSQNITFKPTPHFDVPAGGTQEITMEIQVPVTIKPDVYYSGYIIAESDDAGTKRVFLNIKSLAEAELEILELCNIPNPFREKTAFSYYLTKDATNVYIEIFSVSGKRIKKIEDASGHALFNEQPWDGILEDGDKIANGVYIYRVTATDGEKEVSAVEKMAVLK